MLIPTAGSSLRKCEAAEPNSIISRVAVNDACTNPFLPDKSLPVNGFIGNDNRAVQNAFLENKILYVIEKVPLCREITLYDNYGTAINVSR